MSKGRGRGRGRGGRDEDRRRGRDEDRSESSGSGSGGGRSDIEFEDSNVAGNSSFDTFSCNVIDENFDTPDRVRPDRRFSRAGANTLKLEMSDGEDIEFWNFKDDDDSDSKDEFPSRPIRVRVGEVVHSEIKGEKNSHTIHHHGINPTTFNDGVGHTSFEVNGRYTYQFQPRYPGTHFYHCHKNTVLHFEMGMYGLLIVDPASGPGSLLDGDLEYDVEAFWIPDDVDPRWRDLNHSAGLCNEDAGLNVFRPKYFLITGVENTRTRRHRKVRVDARVGETVLVRFLNASYSVVRTTIEGLDAEVVGTDGRILGDPDRPWAQPYTIPAGEPFETVSAQRRDLFFRPTEPGEYRVRMEFHDWITGEIHDNGRGVAETVIRVRA
ncbi:MAG: multicopper oxidase domain-containing protein [Henriciella sp.]|uniref:multicopper oxidase domain-containing protein n=1 Tax=Henriciella sp. TaxID=1968823 RepID=UPI003C78E3C8